MQTDNIQKQKSVTGQGLEKKISNTEFSQIGDLKKDEIIKSWTNFERRFKSSPFIAKTAPQKAYLDSIGKKELKTLDSMLLEVTKKEQRDHKKPIQVMAYADAKKLLWQIMRTKLESQGRKFEYAGNDLEVIKELLKYFIGDESGCLDRRKGVCLSGDVGMGKTFLMECFMSFTKTIGIRTFKKVGCGDIYDKISMASKARFGSAAVAMSKYYKSNIFFDDLGNEPLIFQDFGNRMEYMDRIFFKREEAFRVGLCISHITTNLNRKDIEERYGKRFSDRFRQMFNVVEMTAPSKRR